MYTIVLLDDKKLYASNKETIMQYSNLVDKIQFLVPQEIDENDMTQFTTVQLEYLSPISHLYRQEFLTLSDELYKDNLQYILPVDTKITAEHGDIDLQLSFYRVEMDEDGEVQTFVFKTQPCTIKVVPFANWAQFMPSESLTSLDQRILKLLALQEEITEIQEQIINTQTTLIDDENISDRTTYSSKKIEEFIDQSELDNAVDEAIGEMAENAISDEDVDGLFGNELPNLDKEDNSDNVITDEEIDDLFK